MSRVDEFDTFYDATRRYLLHLTYALCGNRTTTAAAVREAYQRAWQHWPRLRSHDVLAYVRSEAWRLSLVERGTHPWRRRTEDDSDVELLSALQSLPPDSRRLIVLQTLGEVGLETAARDVALTDAAASEATSRAVTALETSLSVDLDQLEERLRDLGRVVDAVVLPAAADVRRQSRRRTRRNTVIGVAASATAVAAAGLISTLDAPMSRVAVAAAREQPGTPSARPTAAPTRSVGTEELLDDSHVRALDPSRTWTITDTSSSTSSGAAPAAREEPCALQTPDPHAAQTFRRTISAAGSGHETSAQAVQVMRTPQAAARAYDRVVRSYADCAQPQVQLVRTWAMPQTPEPTRIVRLRTATTPATTLTVAITRTGRAMSVLEHQVDGTAGPKSKTVASVVSASIARICTDAGGGCPAPTAARATLPLPATRERAFLGVVDLPPVSGVAAAWAATASAGADPNPAATLCDRADFASQRVERARARAFVVPGSRLPKQFGLTETVARFDRRKDATAFVAAVSARIDGCPKDNLSASVEQGASVTAPGGVSGRTWRLTLEVDANTDSYYRIALVRRGRDVAQVSLSPTKKYDLPASAFTAIAQRAAERLAYSR